MKRAAFCVGVLSLFPFVSGAQNSDVKFVADTLVIQAEGTYEADPDLATLTFDIASQEKDLKPAYDKAAAALQKIAALADKNGIAKADVFSGVLLVTPYYEGDRKKRARSFRVTSQIVVKVRDFTKLGPIMDESVTDEITDFRSLTYSLADEEVGKQRAVADAMRRATGRANAALAEKGQKAGALRFANIDVTQIRSVVRMPVADQTVEVQRMPPVKYKDLSQMTALNAPVINPEKIMLRATVQCAFQISQ
jgi:uncharacterized protein